MGTGNGVEEQLQGIVILFGKGSKIMDPPAASMLSNMKTLVSGREGGPSGCSCRCLVRAEARSPVSS